MDRLVTEIKQCRACENYIEPNPILSISNQIKIIVIGQAPGNVVHQTGIPWNDKSGDNLNRKELFGIFAGLFCFATSFSTE